MSLEIMNKMFGAFTSGFSTGHLGYKSVWWVFGEDIDYVVFKNKGHTAYNIRSENGYVPASYYLYRVDKNFDRNALRTCDIRDPNLLWHQEGGKISKKKLEELRELVEEDRKKVLKRT